MPVPHRTITRERIMRWERKLSDSHATPMILLGIGHDQNSGQLVICTLEESEMPNSVVIEFLTAALRMLAGSQHTGPAPICEYCGISGDDAKTSYCIKGPNRLHSFSDPAVPLKP